jgi:hypothetical protein
MYRALTRKLVVYWRCTEMPVPFQAPISRPILRVHETELICIMIKLDYLKLTSLGFTTLVDLTTRSQNNREL